MKELASLFIDDELSLDEKLNFVDAIHDSNVFYTETKQLIDLEMVLSSDVTDHAPPTWVPAQPVIPGLINRIMSFIRPVGYALTGTFAALIFVFVSQNNQTVTETRSNRFVIYKPDVSKVEITGSFTLWEKVPLHEAGDSGYWEVTLEIPRGVHRFTYILDDHTPFADPTVPSSEMDDFGGKDSILTTEI